MEVHMTRIAKHRIFCLVLSFVLAAQLMAFAQEAYPYVSFATASVRLRSRPSSTGTILDVVQSGEAVLVTGTEGNYRAVEYEGRKGYIMSSFLEARAQGTPDPLPPVDASVSAKYPFLQAGAESQAVKALQQALIELGFYGSGIDSKYGSGTTQGVRAFQEANSLPSSGQADPATQELLFEGLPFNRRGVKTRVKTLPAIDGITIRPDNEGVPVEAIQQRLKELELYQGAVDGKYGTATQAAVRGFQQANGLKVDGIVGSDTYAKLFPQQSPGNAGTVAVTSTLSPEYETAAPTDDQGEATYPYRTTTSSAVNLRKTSSLSSMRYLTIPQGAAIEVQADEEKFQKVSYRDYTGYVMTEYVNIPEVYLSGKSLDTDPSARVNYETLAVGSEGAKVRALQQALSELGFYSGKIDGEFGAGTLASLKALQAKNGLRATGIALPELQKMVYEERVRNSKNKRVLVNTLPPIDGYPMQEGDYGDAVYALHQALTQLGHYDGALGHEYTRATALAVRAYQKDHSIKITGKADAFTLLSIKTFLGTQAPVQSGSTALTPDTVIEIQSGTRGQAVTDLQERLVALGYYNVLPDGVFDGDDVAALRQFQRVNGLAATGKADLVTQQVLYSMYALADGEKPTPGAISEVTPVLLKMGTTGDAVRAMQSRLIVLGYLTGNADGIFGTQTARAVSNFQRTNSLDADGIAGELTLTALYGAKAISNAPTAAPTATAGAVAASVYKLGAAGSEVAALQQRLITLGYLTGAADGIFGPRTALAVQGFQQRNSLDSDGIAGKLTLAKLNAANAIAASGVTAPLPTTRPTSLPGTGSSFQAPKASEVRFANWYTEVRGHAQRVRNAVIYDFTTGMHYNFRFYSFGKHGDGDVLTKADTAVMNAIMGANNWTPRPVWVIFSDGRVYMGSTHSHGHEVDYIPDNDLAGHLCVHFPREMAEAAQTGPYAVSHQNAILKGWDLTQGMAR